MSRILAILLLCGTLATPNFAQTPPTQIIEKVEIQGLRRLRENEIRGRLKAKPGAVLNEAVLARDLITLQETGSFLEVNMFKQPGEHGGTIVRFVVVERKLADRPTSPSKGSK